MRLRLQLELPADARLLLHTRRALAGYLDDLGASAELVHESILALDEACANVVRHAFPRNLFPSGGGTYRVSADLDGRELVMVVEDDGVGFDPFEATGLGSGKDSEAGRGLGLIRQLMTSVEVESPRPGGGTRLCMRRDLNAAGSFVPRPSPSQSSPSQSSPSQASPSPSPSPSSS